MVCCVQRRLDTKTSEGDASIKVQVKRLVFNNILAHYRKYKAEGIFLVQACEKTIGGVFAVDKVYVMPKYSLEFGTERPADMQAVMRLAMATNIPEVHLACANPSTGHYDIYRHMGTNRLYAYTSS